MAAYSFFNGHRCKSYRFFLFCMSLLFLLWGCGGDSSSEPATNDRASSASDDTGSASFAIQWHTAAAVQASAVVRQAIENCETAGVVSITCEVYDESGNHIASGGPWNCSDHHGTIEQIPAGSNRTFAALGWSGAEGTGDTVYKGQTAGISISPGTVTEGVVIDAYPFVPDAPVIGDEIYGNQIDLSWNDMGVYGYRIYRNGAAVADSTSPTHSDTGLTPQTQYCYTISAIDGFGNESAQSGQTCATTALINIWYGDNDEDGYGDPGNSIQDTSSSPPEGYVGNHSDCDDQNGAIHPNAKETCNGLDDDCDQSTDEGVQNTYYFDNDGDGYGGADQTTQACAAPEGFVGNHTDCDDHNGAIHPNAEETCNGLDDDCDQSTDEGVQNTYYFDNDGDGYGGADQTTQACAAPEGFVGNHTDCDDHNGAIHPNAKETCNGLDDDCDQSTDEGLQNTYYFDYDQDTYGDKNNTTLACSVPDGYVTNSSDCDDHNGAVHPGVEEICYDNIDNNCSGAIDEDCPFCYQDLASPELEFIGAEPIYINDVQYMAYYLTVTNRAVYPDEMFESSQDYPPCDQDDFGSRTVVEIYDSDGNFLDDICNVTSPDDDLQGFYFVVYPGTAPAAVYINLVDQACDLTYRSNRVTIKENKPGELYDNGDSLWDGATSIISQVVADDFSLATESRLTGASVDLWYNATTFDYFGTINWWIFEDANGLPGSIIAQGSGANYSPDYVEPSGNGNTHFWTLDFNFGREITLSAEKRYWFGIRALGQEIGVLWSDTGANGYNDASSENGTFDNWRQDSSASRNLAFRLTGY